MPIYNTVQCSFFFFAKQASLHLFPGCGTINEIHVRCRKRLSQLLHTHVALITVCVLSALDATCVLGQIICDILIMTASGKNLQFIIYLLRHRNFLFAEKQHANELLQADATKLLKNLCPNELNHTSNEDGQNEHEMTLQEILEKLKDGSACKTENHDSSNNHHRNYGSNINAYRSYGDIHSEQALRNKRKRSADTDEHSEYRNILHRPRNKRAAAGDTHGHSGHHGVLYELTHAFHLGSMIILSLLLLETFLKIFSMGQKFLHHKLEVFDAFVVTVSWCLDVGFWEGLWHQPGTEAATILIVILPWRVIRIVNIAIYTAYKSETPNLTSYEDLESVINEGFKVAASKPFAVWYACVGRERQNAPLSKMTLRTRFVLVIQEKDMVLLKLMKQQYRMLLKKGREMKSKLEIYRVFTILLDKYYYFM
ncbi:hypothetical protein KUTeg_022963 [Tegillarca granosa]|uniref:Voltage-gated hydrogen channel 1 n=1 Tax=Tegillarca granosa TaxID=220873 RepID=A0ABQ9E6I7_TEGGR|nr:hypothetical protein KUTeg_022963 [Tegillarca granosa]